MAEKKDMEHIVDDAIKPVLGVSIDELNRDISEKISRNPLAWFEIDTKLKFKAAKKRFKQQFLRRLLRTSYGNISIAAKRAGVDRRSIHRIVNEAGINVTRMRADMEKPYQVKQKAVESVIENVLEQYKQVIHPSRMAEVYKNVNAVSKDILDEMPDEPVTLKQAEHDFEREYFMRVLAQNHGNVTATAKKIGLRYETLLRKLKARGLR